MLRLRTVICGTGLLACAWLDGGTACAATATFDSPALDRWMYPFNSTPGTRTTASTFGAVGSAGFDDRDAQFLVGFDTSGQVPTGHGAANYQINAVRVTAKIAVGDAFAYDPSYDAQATYDGTSADTDTGRPIELHGVGFRNGYAALSFNPADASPPAFHETTAFGPGGPPAEGVRHAFAMGFDSGGNPIDVSNNVTGGFESNPWAVGASAALTPGQLVPADSVFTFDFNLSDANVLQYVQDALDAGVLGLTINSIHAASFGGNPSYPIFYTRDNLLSNAAPPTLFVDYTIVPEPSAALLTAAAAAGALLIRRRRWSPTVDRHRATSTGTLR